MTFGKYIITNFLKSIKIYNGSQSLAAANSESHLIHEGMKLLGHHNLEHIEEIEDLKSAYWEVQEIKTELETLQVEERQLTSALDKALAESSQNEENNNEQVILLQDEHTKLLRKQQDLSVKRDSIEAEGRKILKIHQGLKAEREHSSDTTELDQKIKFSLKELKELKALRDQLTAQQDKISIDLQNKKSLIKDAKNANKSKSSTQSSVSKSNQSLTNNRVEQTKRQTRLDELYFQVGEYLVANQKIRETKKCIKSQKRILTHIKALTKSVHYHRLLGHR